MSSNRALRFVGLAAVAWMTGQLSARAASAPAPAEGSATVAAAVAPATVAPRPRVSVNIDAALREGSGRLQHGDAKGAAGLLEAVTRAEPGNVVAWRKLGNAYQQLHDYDRALQAYSSALRVQPDLPQVLYAVGTVYAAKKDFDRALDWFGRARATHRFDMTELKADPALAELRKDVRFAALLPRPADFENPFVEPTRILHEWRGEAAEDQFGWIARNIGDVDGDGIPDIVTSAPSHGANASSAGRVYVYSTHTGTLLWTADGSPGDEFGSGVEAAGDTNHDGIPDVVASGPSGKGVARIFSGRDGRVLQTFRSADPHELFGTHVSGAGDVDRDGFADVIVGAPGKEGESKIAGHAYVYSGKDGKLLFGFQGERVGDGFGSSVAGYAHGRQQFLVVGAPRAGPGHHGRVYVYDGLSDRPKFTIDADATGDALGMMFVSVPGDLDQDGVSEIYASDWSNAAKGPSTGRVYILSGRTGIPMFTLTGQSTGEGFGTSSSVAGDVDGDGRADLIVGAWQYGKAAVSGGRAYLFSGRDGRLIGTFTCRTPGDTFGFDAVGMGDVDGDGTVDLLVTSGWSAVNGHHSGRVFLISSGIRHNFGAPHN